MMKFRLILVMLCLFLGGQLIAQTILTGVVTDDKNAPIPYANVYLSKTTMGVITNDKGTYSLPIAQDGFYELICSCVGFETHSQMIKANGSPIKINLQLPQRIILIKEVSVKGKDGYRQKNYDEFLVNYNLFLNCFIGRTMNAPFCTIKNPNDLVIYRDSLDGNLIAYSFKPLIIEHVSFGYTILYQLNDFCLSLQTGQSIFSGNYYFQELNANSRQKARWHRNRLIAYYGSRMHFLRALYADSISEESFEICDLELDSCGIQWVSTNSVVHEIRTVNHSGSMTLHHLNPIEIKYSDNHPELFPLPFVYKPSKYESRITIFSDSLPVYKNGYYPDVDNILWWGNMARDRVAELLPFDFVPKPIGKTMKTNF